MKYSDLLDLLKSCNYLAEHRDKYLNDRINSAILELESGNLELPWIDKNLNITHQPIIDIISVGTPIDPDTGDDLELDLSK